MSPERHQAGAASHRKIGGDLQGEPVFLLMREAPAYGREQKLPEGLMQTREKIDAIEYKTTALQYSGLETILIACAGG